MESQNKTFWRCSIGDSSSPDCLAVTETAREFLSEYQIDIEIGRAMYNPYVQTALIVGFIGGNTEQAIEILKNAGFSGGHGQVHII